MSKKEFSEIATMFKNAYRQKNFMAVEDEWNVWYECLKDLQFFYLQKAALQWVQYNKFPPTIAELRESYHKIVFEERNNPENRDKFWQ
ncbi:replicative helicase loader/inhibitor [Lachnospiraceae bacterium 54-53]